MTRTLILTRYEYYHRHEIQPGGLPVIEAAYVQHLRDCNISSEAEDCGRAWKLGFAAQNGIEVVEMVPVVQKGDVPTLEQARDMIRAGQSIGIVMPRELMIAEGIVPRAAFRPVAHPATAVMERPTEKKPRRKRVRHRSFSKKKPPVNYADRLVFRADDRHCDELEELSVFGAAVYDLDDSQARQILAISGTRGDHFMGKYYDASPRPKDRLKRGQFVKFSRA